MLNIKLDAQYLFTIKLLVLCYILFFIIGCQGGSSKPTPQTKSQSIPLVVTNPKSMDNMISMEKDSNKINMFAGMLVPLPGGKLLEIDWLVNSSKKRIAKLNNFFIFKKFFSIIIINYKINHSFYARIERKHTIKYEEIVNYLLSTVTIVRSSF